MKEFEKKYDGITIEKQIQKYWEDNKVFAFHPDKSKPIYSIDTPPPTVNGALHIGHIFSYTQAEMIARYRRMKGFNVFYPFGFDDNGLPSERLVEKESGIKAKDLPRSAFIQKCVETTQKYENEFKELWRSMGFSCDWDLCYSTVSKRVQRVSQKSFIELAKEGKAYTKESPVLWCTECQTSIAQAELDTKEIDSSFNYLPFFCDDHIIEIATTRPELLYGVVCVFVNPADERYTDYIGKQVKVPLYDFYVPVIADEKASIEKGTGAVMCATFGDATDMEWVEQYGLPYKKVTQDDGRIAEDVPFIGGLYVKKARKQIIQILQEKNLLLKSVPITHMVAVHERCGTEVEIIPSKQWYIDVLSKKEELLALGDRINWYPSSMKNRFVSWVENLKWDWCISRQRYFGVPFPVWYCTSCGEPSFASIDSLPVNPLEQQYEGICKCGCSSFVPETSVLDTWATSSLTPLINKDTAEKYGINEEFMPMSMRTQAHEIIRTWAFYTITRSLYYSKDIPWNDAMICGFVLAKPGEKISKSKGNAQLSPQKLVDTYSADAIRYWAANARLGTDTFFDQQEMQDASRRTIVKLWNSSKFVFSHLEDFEISQPPVHYLPVDRWIIERTNQAVIEASKWLDQYEIGLARKIVDDLFWKDLCDNYIEIVKERLYQPDIHGEEERKSAQHAIYYSLLTILKMYSIYMPHETEYIFLKGLDQIEGQISIHKTLWPKVNEIDEDLIEFGNELKAALADMRKYKTDNNMSMKADIETFRVNGSEKYRRWFVDSEKDLKACIHATTIEFDLK